MAGALALAVVVLLGAADAGKPSAEYQSTGAFTGGTATAGMVLTGVRFGPHDDFLRMVLDFEDAAAATAERSPAKTQPVYRVEYFEFPYRLVLTFQGVQFDEHAQVDTKPALPFSVVTTEDGGIKQMQVFLAGPSEFKVIEIDDPAKLSVDLRALPRKAVPTIYTVQITGPATASEAFALLEQGKLPEGCKPAVLVLGKEIVVEQVFADASAAQAMDAALRELGYSTVINERRGNELPQG